MTDKFKTYLAQLNPTVGDISNNIELINKSWEDARKLKADIFITPELVVCGYPPEDLLLRPSFLKEIETQVQLLIRKTEVGGPAIILGAPWIKNEKLYNASLVIDSGKLVEIILKNKLPNYGVFDEKRLFSPSNIIKPVDLKGIKCGIMICEDMWSPDVSLKLAGAGAEIFIVINASPYELDKTFEREKVALERVNENHVPLVYINQVGGQDELVFDGKSFAINEKGERIISFPTWRSYGEIISWDKTHTGKLTFESKKCQTNKINNNENIYSALVVGLKDYITKNKFEGVIIGMSGGIDSAVTASIAADALGREKVNCIMMPSIYTSNESLTDAKKCADLLGVNYEIISIKNIVEEYGLIFKDFFHGRGNDVTEENIQSRIRGSLLMSLSNKFGSMVLATGNKSEMSVGYATLYGDMCGGFAVLKDVYKTVVFEIAKWRNINYLENFLGNKGKVIPESIITKAPTAELKPNQLDEDTLPSYDILDHILISLIEKEQSLEQLIDIGVDKEILMKVYKLLQMAEYKRRQSPPGIKITSKSFGRERRYPITNGFFEKVKS